MNAHQRRKTMRARGRVLGLDRVPDRVYVHAFGHPDNVEQSIEMLESLGVQPPGLPLATDPWEFWREWVAHSGSPFKSLRRHHAYHCWRMRRAGCPLPRRRVVVSELMHRYKVTFVNAPSQPLLKHQQIGPTTAPPSLLRWHNAQGNPAAPPASGSQMLSVGVDPGRSGATAVCLLSEVPQ